MTRAATPLAACVVEAVGSLAGVLLMLPPALGRTRVLGRPTAWLGIGGNLVGLGLYVPGIGLALSAGSGLVLWFWYVLLARRLLRLAIA